MEIPPKVFVLGLTYDVCITDLDDSDGVCIPSKQRIELRQGMSKEKTEQVFFHELIHALLSQLSYDDLYEDEHLVQSLAIGIHQALSQAELFFTFGGLRQGATGSGLGCLTGTSVPKDL